MKEKEDTTKMVKDLISLTIDALGSADHLRPDFDSGMVFRQESRKEKRTGNP